MTDRKRPFERVEIILLQTGRIVVYVSTTLEFDGIRPKLLNPLREFGEYWDKLGDLAKGFVRAIMVDGTIRVTLHPTCAYVDRDIHRSYYGVATRMKTALVAAELVDAGNVVIESPRPPVEHSSYEILGATSVTTRGGIGPVIHDMPPSEFSWQWYMLAPDDPDTWHATCHAFHALGGYDQATAEDRAIYRDWVRANAQALNWALDLAAVNRKDDITDEARCLFYAIIFVTLDGNRFDPHKTPSLDVLIQVFESQAVYAKSVWAMVERILTSPPALDANDQ